MSFNKSNTLPMAIYVGTRLLGFTGAGAALAGLTLVPLAIMLGLGVVYFHYHHLPAFQATLTGLVSAGAGLTLSMAVKSGLDIIRQSMAVTLAVAAFIGVAILRWPLLVVLAVLAPIGMAWYWPGEAKHREEEPSP
jgi:chromate transporter